MCQIMCFGQKLKKQQQQNNTSPLPEPGIEPWTSRTQTGCVSSAPLSEL